MSSVERVPSVEQIRAIARSARAVERLFCHAARYIPSEVWAREEDFASLLGAFLDSLPAVESLDKAAFVEWPVEVWRGIDSLRDELAAVIELWQWERLRAPRAEREAYLKERREWAAEAIERPRYEAAISIQEG